MIVRSEDVAVRIARTFDSHQEFAGAIVHDPEPKTVGRIHDVPALCIVVVCDGPALALTNDNGLAGEDGKGAIYIDTTRESALESLTLRAVLVATLTKR